jgi:endoglucanase Acf2
MAVFPLPLSFKPSQAGFSFGLPTVTSSPNTITGGYTPAINVGLGAAAYKVTRYDDVSVTLTYFAKDASEIGSLTIAEGYPFVSYTAAQKQQFALPGFAKSKSAGTYTKSVNGQVYGSVIHGGQFDGEMVTLAASQSAVFYAVAEGATVESMADYAAPLQSVVVEQSVNASTAQTTLRYITNGQDALVALLPEHGKQAKPIGSYTSIYGEMSVVTANEILFKVPRIEPSVTLNVSRLSTTDKQELQAQLQADASSLNLTKSDTYFGAKELYRAANIYALAKQLDDREAANSTQAALETTLSQWFDPESGNVRGDRSFYYDTTVRGIVGRQASFGSEQFNDHHFHYGYFLYAMAVLARYDPAFAAKYSDFTRLLATDIAAPVQSADFPRLRVFDPYMGHSWAAGYGQAEDGNNQESSSEAINAWNGLAAWALAVGDTSASTQATWLLSHEVAAASAYWTAPPKNSNFQDYEHQTYGINWGGKRDYATFFSPEPAAIFGIQLIPMPPVMETLRSQKNRIGENLAATLPDGNYSQQFGDYLLMYRSLTDKQGALAAARQLPDTAIDDGNSRSYMLAWILSQ